MTELIDGNRLSELRLQKCSTGNCPCHEHWESALHTIEYLWRVVWAAKRWLSAPPGRDSVEKEMKMKEEVEFLDTELYDQRNPDLIG